MVRMAEVTYMANCANELSRTYRIAYGVEMPPRVQLPSAQALTLIATQAGLPIKKVDDGLAVRFKGCEFCYRKEE